MPLECHFHHNFYYFVNISVADFDKLAAYFLRYKRNLNLWNLCTRVPSCDKVTKETFARRMLHSPGVAYSLSVGTVCRRPSRRVNAWK